MKTVLAAVLAMLAWGISGEANAAHFAFPKWNGYALDWCKNFEQACGKPAADLYCQKRGYPQAVAFNKLNRVSYQTMTIGQNAICDPRDHVCDSFSSIDCQETVATFYAPKYNGYRLDWCREFEGACGAPAALRYCQKAGYAQLVSFHIQPRVSVPTMTVGSNAVCNPAYHTCDSFSYVQCKH